MSDPMYELNSHRYLLECPMGKKLWKIDTDKLFLNLPVRTEKGATSSGSLLKDALRREEEDALYIPF